LTLYGQEGADLRENQRRVMMGMTPHVLNVGGLVKSAEEYENVVNVAVKEWSEMPEATFQFSVVYAQKPSRPGENVLNDSANVLQELTTMGNPTNIQNLIASIGAVGAEEILSLDPTDKQDGFTELEAWVDGSLDMYRGSGPLFCRPSYVLTRMESLSSVLFCSLYFAIST